MLSRKADRRPCTPDRFLDRLLPALPAVLLLLIFAAAVARAQDRPAVAAPVTGTRLTLMVMPFDAPMGSLDRGRRFAIETLAPLVPLLVQGPGGLPGSRFAEPVPASASATPLPPSVAHTPGIPWPRTPPLDRPSSRAQSASYERSSEAAAVSDIGVAVATLLMARLVADGRFRVLDAAQLAALRRAADDCEAGRARRGCGAHAADARPPGPGELYLVNGAILRLGPQEKSAIAGGGRFSLLGVLGFKRRRMEMTVVARVVDAATGEVIASTTASGRSDAKGSIGGGVIAGGGAAGVGSSEQGGGPSEQAMTRAVDALAVELARMTSEHGTRKR